ncbi:MAG: hypothetical protein ABIK85_00055 [Candidatus Eisenbacteria bacterium]
MRVLVICLVVCFIITGTALAQKPDEIERPKGADRLNCITDGYDAYTGGTGGPVPDANPVGATFGPLMTYGTSSIEDVILNVNISATWIGDVRLWLLYDTDCDGYPEVTGQLLCRHSYAGCPADGCCGCSGNLSGWYGFDDTSASIEDLCPSVFAPGCYGPDYDSSGLDVFDDYASGGCFWLFCADGAGGDATSIGGWEVYVLTAITPVEESTWGMVKAMYR